MSKQQLKITERIAAGIFDIVFNIHPEGNKEVEYYRRAQCKKRNVNKVSADNGGSNSHLISNRGTNAKHLPFNEVFYLIHFTKLKLISLSLRLFLTSDANLF